MVTLIVVAPAALGLGEADGEGDAVADAEADADPDGFDADGEAFDALGVGALFDTVVLGSGTALGETGTEHAGALLALGATLLPVESTTCTGWLPSAAVTLTRLTGWWLLLKIQSATGTFAPCG